MPIVGNPMDYFQIGRQIQGVSPMETFVTNITQRLQQHMQMQNEMNMKLAMEPELKRRETLAQLGAYKEARESGLLPNYGIPGQQTSTVGSQSTPGVTTSRVSHGNAIGQQDIVGGEVNPLTNMFTPRVGPTQQSEIDVAKRKGLDTLIADKLRSPFFAKTPVLNHLFGTGESSSLEAALSDSVNLLTQDDIPALKAAVQNGVFKPEHSAHLSALMKSQRPDLENPFEQNTGQSSIQYTPEQAQRYNQARHSGLSQEEAKRVAGIQ